MAARTENEVKLELPTAAAPRLQQLPLIRAVETPPKRMSEVSVYFDTRKHKLRKHGLMLRVRHSDGRYVQTIKATKNGDIFAREEWEYEIAGPEPDLGRASGTDLAPLVSKKLRRRLRPIFETRVRRTVYLLARDSCAVALTIDRGTIDTGNASVPLCELEVELERGSETDLFAIAREITDTLPAHLSMSSKAERGYRLANGQVAAPIRLAPASLKAELNSRDAFQRIGRVCLQQILGNEPALLNGDAEGVHQMRVGIRRLRAAMSLHLELLRDPQTADIKAGLKWLAEELGPAREFDVLMRRLIVPVRKQRSGWRELAALTRRLAERQKAAHARACEAVNSERFQRLTLETAAWLETGEWTQPQDDLVRDRGALPVKTLACEQLKRRWRKVRKRRKSLAVLDTRRRHKLRIQVKKLRYAVEFFADLFAGRSAEKLRKRFLDATERVQDCLGELNDIAVHERLIGALGTNRHCTRDNGAFAAGLLSGREDARSDAAMAVASAALLRLAEVKPFWR